MRQTLAHTLTERTRACARCQMRNWCGLVRRLGVCVVIGIAPIRSSDNWKRRVRSGGEGTPVPNLAIAAWLIVPTCRLPL